MKCEDCCKGVQLCTDKGETIFCPVIRCKDCVYFNFGCCDYWDGWHTEREDFCSQAEQRKE